MIERHNEVAAKLAVDYSDDLLAPLPPGSQVIWLVTFNAGHIGHVRRDTTQSADGCWVTVALKRACPFGRHDSVEAAARGLARAYGKDRGLCR